MTNVIFGFETSPNTNPKRESGGTWHIMSPRLQKWRSHPPCPLPNSAHDTQAGKDRQCTPPTDTVQKSVKS